MRYKHPNFWRKMVLGYIWAVPWVIVGAALCLTVIGSPIGLLFLYVGTLPLVKLHERQLEGKKQWDRTEALPQVGTNEEPWRCQPSESLMQVPSQRMTQEEYHLIYGDDA